MLYVWGYTKYSVTNKMNTSLGGSARIHSQDPNAIGSPIIWRVFADVSQASYLCTSTRHSYERFIIMVTLNQTLFGGSHNIVAILTNSRIY